MFTLVKWTQSIVRDFLQTTDKKLDVYTFFLNKTPIVIHFLLIYYTSTATEVSSNPLVWSQLASIYIKNRSEQRTCFRPFISVHTGCP